RRQRIPPPTSLRHAPHRRPKHLRRRPRPPRQRPPHPQSPPHRRLPRRRRAARRPGHPRRTLLHPLPAPDPQNPRAPHHPARLRLLAAPLPDHPPAHARRPTPDHQPGRPRPPHHHRRPRPRRRPGPGPHLISPNHTPRPARGKILILQHISINAAIEHRPRTSPRPPQVPHSRPIGLEVRPPGATDNNGSPPPEARDRRVCASSRLGGPGFRVLGCALCANDGWFYWIETRPRKARPSMSGLPWLPTAKFARSRIMSLRRRRSVVPC